jgi:uncharacterized repeat protein (TIGR01451 family)
MRCNMVYRIARIANHIIALSVVCVTALVLAPALASGVPAGVIIENTAEATYEDGGITFTATSNTVQIKVDELLNVSAASLDAGPLSTRPGAAVLTFQITNSGNGPEAFLLEADPAVAGNDFDAVIDGIAIDTNGNGVYDVGIDDILPGPETTPVLAADTSVTVFVLASVPAGLADGAQSQINLTARATTGSGAPGTVFAGAGENDSDAVVGATGATALASGLLVASTSTVALTKSANVSDPLGGTSAVPGAVITYSIEASLSGSAPIDGLVITDAIPANTQYVANSLSLNGAPLTDAPGDDAGEADGAGISVDLGTVAAGSSHTITFSVTIDE